MLPRGSADETVVSAARALVAGRPVIDAFAARVLLGDYAQLEQPPGADALAPPRLDPREQQVLELLATAATWDEIADRLGRPATTGANLVENALRKLQRWARATARARRAEAETARR